MAACIENMETEELEKLQDAVEVFLDGALSVLRASDLCPACAAFTLGTSTWIALADRTGLPIDMLKALMDRAFVVVKRGYEAAEDPPVRSVH